MSTPQQFSSPAGNQFGQSPGMQQSPMQVQQPALQQPQPVQNPQQPAAATPQQPVQQKELTLLNFCSIGQETVQDIVSRFQEVFKLLNIVHPPNG